MSYSEMIANSESCPYDGTTQLVICNMLVSIFNLVLSPANSIIISKRCQWGRMSWPMGDQQTESTSSPQTGRNQGLTTPMNSGSRTEKCCWRKQNKHCLSLERIPQKNSYSDCLSPCHPLSLTTKITPGANRVKRGNHYSSFPLWMIPSRDINLEDPF